MIIIKPNRSPKTVTQTTPARTATQTAPTKKNSGKVVKFNGESKILDSVMDTETYLDDVPRSNLNLVDFAYLSNKDVISLVDDAWATVGRKGLTWVKKNARYMLDSIEVGNIKNVDTALVAYHTLVYLSHVFQMDDPDDLELLIELETHMMAELHNELSIHRSVNWEHFGDTSYSSHACAQILSLPLVIASVIAGQRERDDLSSMTPTCVDDPYGSGWDSDVWY